MKMESAGKGIVAGLLGIGAVFLLPLSAPGNAAVKTENVPARLFSVRDGMPNLAAKLEAGKKVEIVFLGGSITVMGGYTNDGYVRYVERWLKERYPRAEIKVRNAGVPGTGSEYGAKRYDRDVLRHKPDAVFIEFAVNDGKSDQTASMERMVHKSWRKDPRIDLVFFYTLDGNSAAMSGITNDAAIGGMNQNSGPTIKPKATSRMEGNSRDTRNR